MSSKAAELPELAGCTLALQDSDICEADALAGLVFDATAPEAPVTAFRPLFKYPRRGVVSGVTGRISQRSDCVRPADAGNPTQLSCWRWQVEDNTGKTI